MELTVTLAEQVTAIAREAGELIVRVREQGLRPERKSDNTPVTEADKAADRLIVARLQPLAPTLPIVSEESGYLPDAATLPERFWLVDPLDGTNGFIRGGKNFTVNIALIEQRRPVFGVIYAPIPQEMYAGGKTFGAYRVKDGKKERIEIRKVPKAPVVLVSSHHAVDEKETVMRRFPKAMVQPLSSSVKFCRVAEGAADVYLRSGETSEWDTAAGQAIVEAAGGKVLTYPGGEAFLYAKPQYRNPGVIAGEASLVDALIEAQSLNVTSRAF